MGLCSQFLLINFNWCINAELRIQNVELKILDITCFDKVITGNYFHPSALGSTTGKQFSYFVKSNFNY